MKGWSINLETKVKLLPSLAELTEKGISVSQSSLSVEIFWNAYTQKKHDSASQQCAPILFSLNLKTWNYFWILSIDI